MNRTSLMRACRIFCAVFVAAAALTGTLGVLATSASAAPQLPGGVAPVVPTTPTTPPSIPSTPNPSTPNPSTPNPSLPDPATPNPTVTPTPAPIALPVWPVVGRPRILMFGDSLAWEAKDFFSYMGTARGAEVRTFTFGGTAICDFLSDMKAQAESFHPQAVVVAFSGNNLTSCMSSAGRPLIDQAYYDRYANDVATTMAAFPRSVVYWVGAPAVNRVNPEGAMLTSLYRSSTSKWSSARFVDGGQYITPGGVWSKTQPCMASEPCVGPLLGLGRVNVVRAPDGGHFCPVAASAVRGVVQSCPVYSSGAFRYAYSMLSPVLAQLRL